MMHGCPTPSPCEVPRQRRPSAGSWPTRSSASPRRRFFGTLDGAICTYGDAGRRAESLGTGLRRAGVSPGDRVAVQVEKSAFSVMLYLACLHAGAIYVPLNTGYTDDEVEYVVRDVEPAVVVRDPRRGASPAGCPTLSADEQGRGTLVDLCDDERLGAPVPDPCPAPGDTAAILYTSGTTGRPKGAVLSQANLASNALALVEVWQFTPATCSCTHCPCSTPTGCSWRPTA